VIVPDGVEVLVSGGGLFASQKIESPERAPIAGGPRLATNTRGPGGTLHVRTPPHAAVAQDCAEALSLRRFTPNRISLEIRSIELQRRDGGMAVGFAACF
jgi:hypothetical protein